MPNDVKGESKKMLTYKEMRRRMELSPEHVKLSNFTQSFYQIFCDAWRGKNYRAVFETDFYIKDGFSYCVFLELFEESLPKWRLTFSRTTYGYPMDIARRYIHEDTEEAAKARGQELLALYEANYVDVIRVAC